MPAGYKPLSDADIGKLRQLLNWVKNFQVAGDGVKATNTPDGFSAYISWPRKVPAVAQDNPSVRTVRIKQDGGSSGDTSTTCSYTYSCYARSDTALATPLKQTVGYEGGWRLLEKTQMTKAPDGSLGTVMINGDDWFISFCRETPATACYLDGSGSEGA